MIPRVPPQAQRLLRAFKVGEVKSLEEASIALIGESFGVNKKVQQEFDRLMRKIVRAYFRSLHVAGRAPRAAKELVQEVDSWTRAAKQKKPPKLDKNGKPIPTAKKTIHEGDNVKVTRDYVEGDPGGSTPGGYDRARDLAALANLTPAQRNRAAEFIGRPLGPITVNTPGKPSRVVDLAQVWDKAYRRSPAAQGHMAEVRRLMDEYDRLWAEAVVLLREADRLRLAGQKAAADLYHAQAKVSASTADQMRALAKKCGDTAYNYTRRNFWDEVHSDKELVSTFQDEMGLSFRTNKAGEFAGTPILPAQSGRPEILTLEHSKRRLDDPRLSVDASNLVTSPGRENSLMNEGIRNNSPL